MSSKIYWRRLGFCGVFGARTMMNTTRKLNRK